MCWPIVNVPRDAFAPHLKMKRDDTLSRPLSPRQTVRNGSPDSHLYSWAWKSLSNPQLFVLIHTQSSCCDNKMYLYFLERKCFVKRTISGDINQEQEAKHWLHPASLMWELYSIFCYMSMWFHYLWVLNSWWDNILRCHLINKVSISSIYRLDFHRRDSL